MMSYRDHQQAYYYQDSRSYMEREREHYQYHQERLMQQQEREQPPPTARTAPQETKEQRPSPATTQPPKAPPQKKHSQEEEVASFLLSLKHNTQRSITPEPWADKVVPSGAANYQPSPFAKNLPPVPLEKLLHKSNSMLVSIQDMDLVPDALFLAMAQMVPTRMSYQDRVGCYKSRQVGYLGMCCKHCGGQPGFGRFFPNSVRSLAQTTTSQTILKHVGGKCRHCPEELKRAITRLQRIQDQREADSGKPRYGSRKVFFQRVWDRLHKYERLLLDAEENMESLPAHSEASCSFVPVAKSSTATTFYDDRYHRYLDHRHSDAKYDDTTASSSHTHSDDDQTLEAWPSADTEEATDKKVDRDQYL